MYACEHDVCQARVMILQLKAVWFIWHLLETDEEQGEERKTNVMIKTIWILHTYQPFLRIYVLCMAYKIVRLSLINHFRLPVGGVIAVN